VEDGILTQYNIAPRPVFAKYLINLINWRTICDETCIVICNGCRIYNKIITTNPLLRLYLWILDHHQNLHRILISDDAHFNLEGIKSTRNFHLWSPHKPHGTSQGTFQHRFSVNIWWYLMRDPLIGQFNLEQCLTAANYLHFLTKELPVLMEDVPLNVSCRMFFQSHGATSTFWWSGCDLLSSALRESVDWSCWANILPAQISGPNTTRFIFMGSYEDCVPDQLPHSNGILASKYAYI
jgi:hypothetical protein